jgi:cellulose synthase (UDP-forming)
VGVIWALLNGLLLVAALRCCRDRPRPNATPWLAWSEMVRLNGRSAQLQAISEDGLELQLEDGEGAEGWAPVGTTLQLSLAHGDAWPVMVEAQAGQRLGCRWSPGSSSQPARLQALLYQRNGQWPIRKAPPEPLALAATLLRLGQAMPAETWFQRSLIPLAAQRPSC